MNLPPGLLNSSYVRGLDVRAPNGSMALSDSRQIAAFFLGWVFFYSILCMWQSRFIVDLTRRITHKVFPVAPGVDVEKLEAVAAARPAVSYADIYPPNLPIRGDNPTVLFSMYLCFAIAGLAHFGSLITFNANAGDAGCAFLVAWGTMASELAKVIALSVIALELRQLGVNKKELLVFWVSIVVIIAFAFATTGVATGFLNAVGTTGVAFCNRKHFLPTSLTTSLLEFALAFYAVIRLITCLTSENFNVPSSISSVRDIRIIQVLAFLFFILVTLVPSAVLTNILGDFIPFSVGSLFVLAAFSFTADPLDDKETISPGRTVERSFSTRRGQAHPNLLGVYVPSMSSLRVSPLDNGSPPDLSDHPFAKASPGPMLNRNMSEKSEASLVSRWEYPQSLIQTGRAEENVSFPSKRNTRHTLVKTQRTTPQATPTASISSSIADVGEQPWRNSIWLTRQPNAQPVQSVPPPTRSQPTAENSLKILPSQVEYAARLEQEDAERERKLAMGPVPPPVRPDRPRVQIPGGSTGLLAPADQSRRESMTPNSAAVYGSDIVRLPSGRGQNRMRKHVSWSPQSPDMADPESAVSMNLSRPRYSLTSTMDMMTTTHGSDESLDGGRFTTPPRARRPTFGSDAAPSIFPPSLSSGRNPGAGWRRPSAASVFSQDPLPSGFSVTSPEGNTNVGRANVGLPGGMVAAPRISIIRGPRPPPAAYQPNATLRNIPMLGSVREETPTPTRDMIEKERL